MLLKAGIQEIGLVVAIWKAFTSQKSDLKQYSQKCSLSLKGNRISPLQCFCSDLNGIHNWAWRRMEGKLWLSSQKDKAHPNTAAPREPGWESRCYVHTSAKSQNREQQLPEKCSSLRAWPVPQALTFWRKITATRREQSHGFHKRFLMLQCSRVLRWNSSSTSVLSAADNIMCWAIHPDTRRGTAIYNTSLSCFIWAWGTAIPGSFLWAGDMP